MENPMMKCGHTANSEITMPDGSRQPFCVICNEKQFLFDMPNLDGRVAKCNYCKNKTPSNANLPFFRYRPDQEFDEFICNCFNWD